MKVLHSSLPAMVLIGSAVVLPAEARSPEASVSRSAAIPFAIAMGGEVQVKVNPPGRVRAAVVRDRPEFEGGKKICTIPKGRNITVYPYNNDNSLWFFKNACGSRNIGRVSARKRVTRCDRGGK